MTVDQLTKDERVAIATEAMYDFKKVVRDENQICRNCHGVGSYLDSHLRNQTCMICNGSGKVKVTKLIFIKVEAL